ncbi:MAG: hypothetical protein RL670_109 [Actinomycetota bacterium]|jgi:predicted MPP superfamily phosphohydrolase
MSVWLWVLLSCAIAALAWGSLIERHWYAIRRETLAVLPAGAAPIRVLHIGDIHLAHWQKRKVRFLRSLARLEPDLVVNTGDNLGARGSEAALLEALEPLASTPGAFVNGSNDYHAPKPRNPLSYLSGPSQVIGEVPLDTKALVAGFKSFGWLDLNNAIGQIVVAGNELGFVGVDDAHDGLDDEAVAAKSAAELAGFKIGVSHAPYRRVINAFERSGCQVVFAGHTHGGQVCLPWFRAIITNCDLPAKYAKGLSFWGASKMALNVTAGLGHSIYAPIRFFCRPEVRLLTLVAA